MCLTATKSLFLFKESAMFRGLEGEDPIMAEPNALRRRYLEVFEAYVARLKRGCRELGMDYHTLPTDLP